MTARRPWRGTAAIAGLLAAACASGPNRAVHHDPAIDGAERFFPLALGDAWAYETEGPDAVLFVSRVIARKGGSAVVSSGGGESVRYTIARDGLSREGGATVYRWPARAGDGWPIADGQAVVASIGAREQTPAGVFEGCLVVEETTASRRVTTAFAPGVGPVRVEVVGADGTRVVARLRSFTRAEATR